MSKVTDPIEAARAILEGRTLEVDEILDEDEVEVEEGKGKKKAYEEEDDLDEKVDDDEEDDDEEEDDPDEDDEVDEDEDLDEDDEDLDEEPAVVFQKKSKHKSFRLTKKDKKNEETDEVDEDEDLDEEPAVVFKKKSKHKSFRLTKKEGFEMSDDMKEKINDHVEALFSGEELSEEFKEKASTIFTSAIHERIAETYTDLSEAFDERMTEEVKSITESLTEKVDDYLNYVVKEWMTENKLSVDRGIKADIAEALIGDLRTVFETHNVSLPEEKLDILEQVTEKAEDLQSKLDDQIEKTIELAKTITEHRCNEAFAEVSGGLVDTEIEKLRSLAEGIEFEDIDQYQEKLEVLKESYFNKDNPDASNYEEEVLNEEENRKPVSPLMERYAGAIGRLNVKGQ